MEFWRSEALRLCRSGSRRGAENQHECCDGKRCSVSQRLLGRFVLLFRRLAFLGLFVLTGIAARDVDRELGELGRIAGALAVACLPQAIRSTSRC